MRAETVRVRRTVRHALALIAAALTALQAAGAEPVQIAPFSAASIGDPPAPWKFATLPNKAPTKFTIIELAGAKVLKVESAESYGNLVHSMRAELSPGSVLAWRWRVDKLPEEADLKVRSGEDSAAKVCVFFAFDTAKLSLGERTKLALARSSTGQDVPAQTLCYVWDNKLAAGTNVTSPFTRRVRFMVLDTGTSKLGQWVAQRRSLAADYERMFGDESEGKPPEVTGVAVGADSDNTRGNGLAYVGDISLTP